MSNLPTFFRNLDRERREQLASGVSGKVGLRMWITVGKSFFSVPRGSYVFVLQMPGYGSSRLHSETRPLKTILEFLREQTSFVAVNALSEIFLRQRTRLREAGCIGALECPQSASVCCLTRSVTWPGLERNARCLLVFASLSVSFSPGTSQ